MAEPLTIVANDIAYDLAGEGPLVVLADGVGHYQHAQAPDHLLSLTPPALGKVLPRA